AVDIYQGWVSALGKTVTAKEMITRTIKITNNGRPTLAEILPNPPVIIKTVTQPTEE
ncbi:phage tail tube protein, partial [Proteus terrae]